MSILTEDAVHLFARLLEASEVVGDSAISAAEFVIAAARLEAEIRVARLESEIRVARPGASS